MSEATVKAADDATAATSRACDHNVHPSTIPPRVMPSSSLAAAAVTVARPDAFARFIVETSRRLPTDAEATAFRLVISRLLRLHAKTLDAAERTLATADLVASLANAINPLPTATLERLARDIDDYRSLAALGPLATRHRRRLPFTDSITRT